MQICCHSLVSNTPKVCTILHVIKKMLEKANRICSQVEYPWHSTLASLGHQEVQNLLTKTHWSVKKRQKSSAHLHRLIHDWSKKWQGWSIWSECLSCLSRRIQAQLVQGWNKKTKNPIPLVDRSVHQNKWHCQLCKAVLLYPPWQCSTRSLEKRKNPLHNKHKGREILCVQMAWFQVTLEWCLGRWEKKLNFLRRDASPPARSVTSNSLRSHFSIGSMSPTMLPLFSWHWMLCIIGVNTPIWITAQREVHPRMSPHPQSKFACSFTHSCQKNFTYNDTKSWNKDEDHWWGLKEDKAIDVPFANKNFAPLKWFVGQKFKKNQKDGGFLVEKVHHHWLFCFLRGWSSNAIFKEISKNQQKNEIFLCVWSTSHCGCGAMTLPEEKVLKHFQTLVCKQLEAFNKKVQASQLNCQETKKPGSNIVEDSTQDFFAQESAKFVNSQNARKNVAPRTMLQEVNTPCCVSLGNETVH